MAGSAGTGTATPRRTAKADTLICTTAAGEGIQPNCLTHEFLKAIAGTSLPRIRFHDLRHTHAAHMLKSGVHVKVASERLGHSKIAIALGLYSHVLPGRKMLSPSWMPLLKTHDVPSGSPPNSFWPEKMETDWVANR